MHMLDWNTYRQQLVAGVDGFGKLNPDIVTESGRPEGWSSRWLRAVLGVAVLGLTLGVSQLLRPAAARPSTPTAEEIDRARRIATGQPHPEAILALTSTIDR
jgi:lysylphosphatidylglycerol synthetase-like protein (DUF2156 family)